MNTDEMILALVKAGKFALPEGLNPPDETIGRGCWIRYAEHGYEDSIPDQQAHDLCATHFARQECKMERSPLRDDHYDNFAHALARGESELAIRILFDHFGA